MNTRSSIDEANVVTEHAVLNLRNDRNVVSTNSHALQRTPTGEHDRNIVWRSRIEKKIAEEIYYRTEESKKMKKALESLLERVKIIRRCQRIRNEREEKEQKKKKKKKTSEKAGKGEGENGQ